MIALVIIAALATWQAVEIWRHSSIMAGFRASVETWQPGRLQELLQCPFCLSVHVALFCVIALIMPCVIGPVGYVVAIPVAALAVARLANLGNDVFRRYCRTPRHDRNIGLLPADEEEQ